MSKSRALGLLTALVLAGAPAVVIPVPAGAVGTDPTTMSGAGSHKVGRYKDQVDAPNPGGLAPHVVTYKGLLKSADGERIGGATVWLTRKLASESVQTPLEKGTTGPEGHVSFETPVKGNAKYRILFKGDTTYAPSVSPAMRLEAVRDLNARMVERGSGADKRVYLKGDINPGWANKRVAWQRKTCGSCDWKTIDTKRSGSAGGWSFRAGYPKVGKAWRFRAKIAGTDSFVASTSAKLITQTRYARGSSSLAYLS